MTIFITGCSSGFGLLIAARLSSKGHRVIATMRDLNKQDNLQKEVKHRNGKIDVLRLDVTDEESVREAVSQTLDQYQYIDVLINNAGYGIGGFFEDLTQGEIRQQMETNFFGVQNVTRGFIPVMRQRNRGKIINISSAAGFSTSPCFSAYNASKWALEAFSESLHYELKPFGIDVLLIEPGTYKTKIFFENALYAKNFNDPQSPYHLMSKKLNTKVISYVNSCRKNPEKIAILTEKLIHTKNPSLRNIPDFESRFLYFLRKFLPFKIYSWFIRQALSIN